MRSILDALHVVAQLVWAESQLGIMAPNWCHLVDFTHSSAAGVETWIQQGRRFQ
ncbi:hypothetical protein [Synechococcus sp. MIT S9504]|uniref:hypothetical protein n=1 Tax=Synechococcus sp. MIT S9504 TaxID=1801628 RepID=UPI0018D42428|nr:hypothetical protein [Synechococcus sp. MIT S9504]